jgi:hypothetical protein
MPVYGWRSQSSPENGEMCFPKSKCLLRFYRAAEVVEVLESLPSKNMALSSNSRTTKQKKRKKKKVLWRSGCHGTSL